MEDPRLLLHMNMSFNPFRSSSSHHQSASPSRPLPHHPPPQQQRRIDDPENDSWHTNVGSNSPDASFRRIDSKNDDGVAPQSSFEPPSSALSWFSSWATSSTTTKEPESSSRTASASAATLTKKSASRMHHNGDTSKQLSASMPPPPSMSSSAHPSLSSQLSPAKSMTMNRGLISPDSEQSPQTSNLQDHNSIPPPPLLHDKPSLAKVGGGCLPIQQNNGSPGRILSPLRRLSLPEEKSMDSMQENNVHKFDLPPYPEPKATAPQIRRNSATPQKYGPLLHEFPRTTPKLPSESKTVTAPSPNSVKSSSFARKPMPIIPKEETTFPGFALFQTAKAHYCLGRYSEALDTTTECLALQKLALSGSSEGGSSASAAAMVSKGNIASTKAADTNPVTGSIGNVDASASSMTALDLRSTFATSVGSSVRGVVQSLKDSAATSPGKGQGAAPHPMLSNSIAIMISQYPTHACVAQTLLLRGHVLAACCDFDDDSSLLVQAVQHVEMAIAIQRKLLIPNDDDLARPLIFLAKLKARTGQFEEADAAYKEAVFILMDIRSNIKKNHLVTAKGEDIEVSSDCAKYLKTITREMAHAMYLHGKSYHCQRMHAQAFDCYSHALNVLKKSGVGKDSVGVKRIVQCMRNRYSLEKLVTAYWDDHTLV